MISEAFPPNSLNAVLLSPIHKFLEENPFKFNKNSIRFETKINAREIEEIKNLHDEWFPIRYSPIFFDKILTNNVQIIIAYATVEFEKINDQEKIQKKEIIVGLLTFSIKKVNINYLKTLDKIRALFVQFSKVEILTFGVLLEFRKMKIGSLIFEEFEKLINSEFANKKVRCFLLHVIEHNTAAKRFYEQQGFSVFETKEDYYCIEGKRYSAQKLIKYTN